MSVRQASAVLLLVLACSLPLRAQSSAEANSGLQFNFGSPGARSLGMGGAFVGIADDATAVFVNPAGLTQILKTEVAMEGRVFSYTNSFPMAGRGIGVPGNKPPDNVAALIEGRDDARLAGLTFGSVVVPYDRWSFALYRHELANFQASSRTEGVFIDRNTDPGGIQPGRFYPADSELRLRIVSYGGSIAYRFRDNLSAGVTIAQQRATLDSQTVQYAFTGDDIYAKAAYDTPVFVQEQHGRENNLVLHGGILWRVRDDLTFGASYEQENDFRVRVRSHLPAQEGGTEARGEFHVPAVYRAGAGYTFRHYTKISVEIDRILYSGLTRRFVVFDGEAPLYRVDDGTEIHVGVQRMLVHDRIVRLIGQPLIVSFGGWRDPDHRIRYEDPSHPQSVRFRRGADAYHVSAGASVAVGEAYEAGIAYDYSPRARTASAFLVVRF